MQASGEGGYYVNHWRIQTGTGHPNSTLTHTPTLTLSCIQVLMRNKIDRYK